MLASGFIVFLGIFLIFLKLPRKTALQWLGKPLALDIAATALTAAMHWGTFSGMMAAAVAGLLCSAFSGMARFAFGWIESGNYHPGRIFDLTRSL